MNILRSYLIKVIGDTFLIKWYTSFGIINVFCLFMFAYSFNDFLYNKMIYFIITKISSMTFYIYLIHIFIINNIFKAYHIDKKFHKNSKSIKGHINTKFIQFYLYLFFLYYFQLEFLYYKILFFFV